MADHDALLRDPLPRKELERRWGLLRSLLRERGVDAAVTQAANTHAGIGGYFRWLTGAAVPGSYWRSVVFATEGAMTLVGHGAQDGDMASNPAAADFPGVERRMTAPMFPMVAYTASYDADCVIADLRLRGARRVALIGPTTFAHGFGQRLAGCDDIAWVDFTDEVDRLKAVKSEIEVGLMRRAAAMQDRLIAAAGALIRPGVHEYEVAAELTRLATIEGSLGGVVLTTSGQVDGDGPPMFPRTADMQGRRLRAGDLAIILIENAGPGGMVTHLGRMFALGDVPREIEEAHRVIEQEQDELAAMLLPGADPARLFAEYNARMRGRGLAEETRVHAHGQGYEIVERPLIRSDETMALAANMNIGIHPMIVSRKVLVTAIDNYLTRDGPAERLHQAARGIVSLS